MTSETNTTTTATEGHVLVWKKPADLAAHPLNVRRDLGDLSKLADTIRYVGVLEPLVIVPSGEGDRVVAGHRRLAAAIAAEVDLVPCYVRPDLTAEISTLTAMLVENGQRRPLTISEEAQGYKQLAAFDVSASQIAKATGQKPARVKTALVVAGSNIALAVTSRYDLTLEQAATLAEFADDPEAIKTLTVTAKKDPGRWDHTVSRLRQARQDTEAAAALTAELTEAGVAVVEHEQLPATAARLDTLDDNGKRITPKSHAKCPGHVVVIVADWSGISARYFCTDPKTHGHSDRSGASKAATGQMTDEQKEERRQVVSNNRDWRAALPVRYEFLKTVIGRKQPPKGTLRWVTEVIATHPEILDRADEALLAELCSTQVGSQWQRTAAPQAAKAAADARLPLVLFAQVSAAVEHSLANPVWRNSTPVQAGYLTFLADAGYTVSDVEQLVIDTHTPNTKTRQTGAASAA